VAKGQSGDAGAVFDLASKVGSVSDKRAANGGVMACVKDGAENNLNEAGGRVIASHYRGAARRAGFMPGSWAGMKHDRRASSGIPGSLVNFQIRERNGAFGPAARVGEWGADERPDQEVEWSGGFGNSAREPQRGSQVLPDLAA